MSEVEQQQQQNTMTVEQVDQQQTLQTVAATTEETAEVQSEDQTTTKKKNYTAVKCVIVGDGAVGKTCLLITYTSGKFPEDYVPTLFDNWFKNIDLEGEENEGVRLGLYDTAGQEDYDNIRNMSYPDTNVFIVTYSVDNKNSYENIKSKWIPELRQYCPDVPLVLVANKVDLRDSPAPATPRDSSVIDEGEVGDHVREESVTDPTALRPEEMIKKEEGEQLCEEIEAAAFLECSAFTMLNLNELFEKAIEVGLEHIRQTKLNEQRALEAAQQTSGDDKQGCCTIL